MGLTKGSKSLVGDRRGAALIEFALALPLVMTLISGIVTYGSWLTLAHAVQQSANEAARAGLVGLSSPERAALAGEAARTTLTRDYGATTAAVGVLTHDDGTLFTVDVSLDATSSPLLAMPLVPPPSKTLRRSATVRLAGL